MNKNQPLVLIAPNIRSLHNVGSLFRTADAAGVQKIFLTGYTGAPPDRRIEKVSLGAEQFIPWEQRRYTVPVITRLKKQGYTVVALEQTATSIPYRQFMPTFPLAVVVGNEVGGIPTHILRRCDYHVHLPMMGWKNSLNVSVAWGVFAYYLRHN